MKWLGLGGRVCTRGMSLVWVTGTSGTGKSTVSEKLRALGYAAFDADEGFSCWIDRDTGEVVTDPPCPVPEGWLDRYGWAIIRERVEALVEDSRCRVAFLCGSAENEADVRDLFDLIICLVIDEEHPPLPTRHPYYQYFRSTSRRAGSSPEVESSDASDLRASRRHDHRCFQARGRGGGARDRRGSVPGSVDRIGRIACTWSAVVHQMSRSGPVIIDAHRPCPYPAGQPPCRPGRRRGGSFGALRYPPVPGAS